jgi:hypothetical protein
VAGEPRAHKEHIMPTLQSSTQKPHRARTRVDAGLGALGALIAIGVVALFVALTGTEHTVRATHHPQARAHTRSVAVIPGTFNGFYADPAIYGVARVRTTPCNPAKLRQLRVEKPCYALP